MRSSQELARVRKQQRRGRVRGPQDSPDQRDQICQQARVKGFTVLEGHNNVPLRGSLDMAMQSFQVVVKVPAALGGNNTSADG